ncbi:hypothetical protein FGB62_429g01 [Gracilaria domingensis]|nr:hypothetical protein FGB62_429g01 [Gracilaria domingensis]
MLHVADHLLDFGCIRKGSTDANETMNKMTKAGYSSTNEQIRRLAPRLLTARIKLLDEAIECPSRNSDTVLLARRRFMDAKPPQHTFSNTNESEVAQYDRQMNAKMKMIVSQASCFEHAESVALEVVPLTLLTALWKRVTLARFLFHFE